nr:putative reverse transcriptase domain-containing protein [Tanacetum cinerariifolium]
MELEENDGDDEKSEGDSIDYSTSGGDNDANDDGDDLSEDDVDDEDEEESSDISSLLLRRQNPLRKARLQLHHHHSDIVYEIGESYVAAAARQIRPTLTIVDKRRADDKLIGRPRREMRYFCTLATTYAQEGDVRGVNVDNGQNGCSYKEFMACNPKDYNGKGAGHVAYTDRLHELSRLVPYLVTPKNKTIKRYIYGLAPKIRAMVAATEPTTIQSVVLKVGMLTDDTIRNGSLKKNTEKRGNGVELSRNENVRVDKKRSRTGRAFATITNPVRKEYTGTTPKCTNRNFYHNPEMPCRKCTNYNHLGYFSRDCRARPKMVTPVNARNPTIAQGVSFECGGTDHYKAACPRLNQTLRLRENRQNQPMAIEGGQGYGNNGNQPRGGAFMIGAEEACQDSKIMTGKIVCHKKVVRISLPHGEILRVLGEKPEEKVRHLMSAKTKEHKLKDIVVVRSFLEIELFSDYYCEMRYHLGKANVVADALSRKDRIKPKSVQAMNMTIQSSIKDRILAAQKDASKVVDAPAEMLQGLDKQIEHRSDGSWFWQSMKEALGTRLDISMTYHSQTNCQSDRTIQTLKDMLRACVMDFEGSWDIHLLLAEVKEEKLIGPKIVQETNEKISQIKDRLKVARDCQKSYADKRRKPLKFSVDDHVLLNLLPWKGVIRFEKKDKLTPRFVGLFEITKRIGPVANRLRLPQKLNNVHDTFHVSNLKKCLADQTLHVPLKEIQVDAKLNFMEEPVEILEREFKKLKRSWIPIVNVRWNSKRGPKFTWEHEH